MDVLEEQAHLGPSLGQESHKVDVMTHNLGKPKSWTLTLEAREDTLEITPSPIYTNEFPLEALHHIFGA
jgi:hypothetical protein